MSLRVPAVSPSALCFGCPLQIQWICRYGTGTCLGFAGRKKHKTFFNGLIVIDSVIYCYILQNECRSLSLLRAILHLLENEARSKQVSTTPAVHQCKAVPVEMGKKHTLLIKQVKASEAKDRFLTG